MDHDIRRFARNASLWTVLWYLVVPIYVANGVVGYFYKNDASTLLVRQRVLVECTSSAGDSIRYLGCVVNPQKVNSMPAYIASFKIGPPTCASMNDLLLVVSDAVLKGLTFDILESFHVNLHTTCRPNPESWTMSFMMLFTRLYTSLFSGLLLGWYVWVRLDEG